MNWSQLFRRQAGSFLHEITFDGFLLTTRAIRSIISRAAVPSAQPVRSWISETCTQHESKISDSCRHVSCELSSIRRRQTKKRSLVAPKDVLPPWLWRKHIIESNEQSRHVSSLASRRAASWRSSVGSTRPVGSFQMPPLTAAGPDLSLTRRIQPSARRITQPTPTYEMSIKGKKAWTYLMHRWWGDWIGARQIVPFDKHKVFFLRMMDIKSEVLDNQGNQLTALDRDRYPVSFVITKSTNMFKWTREQVMKCRSLDREIRGFEDYPAVRIHSERKIRRTRFMAR